MTEINKKIIIWFFIQLCKTSLFTKRERLLIFSSLKKSSFLKLILLLNFPIRWSSNWKKIIIWWYLNGYYSMIFIQCYYKISYYKLSICLILQKSQINSWFTIFLEIFRGWWIYHIFNIGSVLGIRFLGLWFFDLQWPHKPKPKNSRFFMIKLQQDNGDHLRFFE